MSTVYEYSICVAWVQFDAVCVCAYEHTSMTNDTVKMATSAVRRRMSTQLACTKEHASSPFAHNMYVLTAWPQSAACPW
jgi:hypothetical protein